MDKKLEVPLWLADCYLLFTSRPVRSLKMTQPVLVSSSSHLDHIRASKDEISSYITIIHPRLRYMYAEQDLPAAVRALSRQVALGPDLTFKDSAIPGYSYLTSDLTQFDTVSIDLIQVKEILRLGKDLIFFPSTGLNLIFVADWWSDQEQRLLSPRDF